MYDKALKSAGVCILSGGFEQPEIPGISRRAKSQDGRQQRNTTHLFSFCYNSQFR